MNWLVKNWRVTDEPSMSNRRKVRLDIVGNSEVERVVKIQGEEIGAST